MRAAIEPRRRALRRSLTSTPRPVHDRQRRRPVASARGRRRGRFRAARRARQRTEPRATTRPGGRALANRSARSTSSVPPCGQHVRVVCERARSRAAEKKTKSIFGRARGPRCSRFRPHALPSLPVERVDLGRRAAPSRRGDSAVKPARACAPRRRARRPPGANRGDGRTRRSSRRPSPRRRPRRPEPLVPRRAGHAARLVRRHLRLRRKTRGEVAVPGRRDVGRGRACRPRRDATCRPWQGHSPAPRAVDAGPVGGRQQRRARRRADGRRRVERVELDGVARESVERRRGEAAGRPRRCRRPRAVARRVAAAEAYARPSRARTRRGAKRGAPAEGMTAACGVPANGCCRNALP